ncbi:hypothetical protein DFH09DRAFT_1338157 [Mycena vulgaris]|nr:hypothetical protein DFH09DRAFT_1338157 [Mycena vulgaris]
MHGSLTRGFPFPRSSLPALTAPSPAPPPAPAPHPPRLLLLRPPQSSAPTPAVRGLEARFFSGKNASAGRAGSYWRLVLIGYTMDQLHLSTYTSLLGGAGLTSSFTTSQEQRALERDGGEGGVMLPNECPRVYIRIITVPFIIVESASWYSPRLPLALPAPARPLRRPPSVRGAEPPSHCSAATPRAVSAALSPACISPTPPHSLHPQRTRRTRNAQRATVARRTAARVLACAATAGRAPSAHLRPAFPSPSIPRGLSRLYPLRVSLTSAFAPTGTPPVLLRIPSFLPPRTQLTVHLNGIYIPFMLPADIFFSCPW